MKAHQMLVVVSAVAMLATAANAGTVTITRDRWGVAHVAVPDQGQANIQIYALGFGQGYATAQDRMVQLEFFRRAGKGRLSEIGFLGAGYLGMDVAARRDGYTQDELESLVKHLPARVRFAFKGFAAGVNQFIQEFTADPSKKPAELSLLGIAAAPWDTTDTAAIAVLQIRRFGQNGGDELDNAVMLLDLLDHFSDTEAKGIFDDALWLEDPGAPTTISPAEQTMPLAPVTRFSSRQMQLIVDHATAIRGAAVAKVEEQTMLASLGRQAGWPFEFPATASNAMVVSGALTASGVPILLGGPQTGMSLPSFFYQIGLHGGRYDAEGVTVPAGAGLVIGRTRNAAWTFTSGITDNTDVYIEELDPANPKRYRLGGSFRPMECRNEVFNVANQAPTTIEICRTAHGPVFASYPGEGIAFSRKLHFWGKEVKAAGNMVSLGFAKTLPQFTRTINKLEASLNCMYADNGGNIAYFHRGIRPLRPATMDPRLPLPGTGEAEVEGYLKGKHMPTAVNPAQGFIAQWNNKPIKGWSADEQRELWGNVDRVQILRDQLQAAKDASHPITKQDVADYMRVAATADSFAPRVFPYLRAAVDALPGTTPDLTQLDAAADLVEAWLAAGAPLVADGSGSIPWAGVTIYREWRTQVQQDTFADELQTHLNGMYYFQQATSGNADDSGSLESPDALFLRALAFPSAALPASRDYFQDVATSTNPGRDATLVGALRTALVTLTARFGTTDPTQWLTPKLKVKFDDSTSASGFVFGPTIIEREDRGTMNQVIELTPALDAAIIVPPGNSGFIPPTLIEPPHLRDQVGPYEAFQYHTLPFTPAELEAPTTAQTLTIP